jgi:tryptophanyl-tRNA synthetase
MHLGHYHGALKNWVRLQDQYDCFYFVADWHALTTHYDEREVIEKSVYDMVIDWLAAGLDPEKSTIFIQSRLPSCSRCSRWARRSAGSNACRPTRTRSRS